MPPGARPARGRLAAAALGFAVAAALASWNPFAAPFGLAVGAASAVLGIAAARRGRRRLGVAAAALGAAAVVTSLAVLARAAGLMGPEEAGPAIAAPRSPAEVGRLLGEAADQTRAERERARRELERGPEEEGGRDGGGGGFDTSR